MARFTDEELEMLTEDERREIAELGDEYDEDNEEMPMDPEDDPEEFEGAEEESDEADPDTDDADAADDPDADDKGEADDDKAADPEPKDDGNEGEGEGGNEDQDEPLAAEQQTPLLNVEMPEGYEDRIKELETNREKLDVDFDDGELTSTEYRQQLREIENQERELREQALKAQIAQEMQQTQQEAAWKNTVNAFLDTNEVYRQSRALYRELNDTVIEIANSEEAAKMTGDQILQEAHKKVAADPALAPVFERNGASKDPEKEVDEKDEGKLKKEPLKRRNVPPTLANVPASDMTDAEEGSQFTKLDKMDGLELEAELSRLERTNPRAYQQYMER